MTWTETELPRRPKLGRNTAGGLICRVPALVAHGTIETWTAAVKATPEDEWSGSSGFDGLRCFRRARLVSARRRRYLAWRKSTWEELTRISGFADGLYAYEIAAIVGRSIRTARRLARLMYWGRQRQHGCRGRLTMRWSPYAHR